MADSSANREGRFQSQGWGVVQMRYPIKTGWFVGQSLTNYSVGPRAARQLCTSTESCVIFERPYMRTSGCFAQAQVHALVKLAKHCANVLQPYTPI